MTQRSSKSPSKLTRVSTSTASRLPARPASLTVLPPPDSVNARNPIGDSANPSTGVPVLTRILGGVANVSAVPIATPPKSAGTPLRQRFTEYLILQQKASRTFEAYSVWIRQRSAFHRKSPDRVSNDGICAWLLHWITVRKLAASSVNLALRAFHNRRLTCPHANSLRAPTARPDTSLRHRRRSPVPHEPKG